MTDQPCLRFEWLRRGAFLGNVSIMEVHKEVFLGADKVVVDDWDQSNRETRAGCASAPGRPAVCAATTTGAG